MMVSFMVPLSYSYAHIDFFYGATEITGDLILHFWTLILRATEKIIFAAFFAMLLSRYLMEPSRCKELSLR
jgi:hypothetical protein